jgi:hypothetical protein
MMSTSLRQLRRERWASMPATRDTHGRGLQVAIPATLIRSSHQLAESIRDLEVTPTWVAGTPGGTP